MKERIELQPLDSHNARLISQAHPSDWTNPEPSGRYNLVVIGGGTAGLVAAAGAAGLGARVALIERHLLGGDCLNFGCVPSKALIRSARAAADASQLDELGVEAPPARADFARVMERLRKLRADISPHDSAERFRKLGVDVFLGDARFTGRDTVDVAGKTLRFKKAIVATGARPATPSLPGLADAGFLTNETIFSLTELPRRLAVIGGGPVGCELAQAFRRLGSDVLLLHRHSHLLDREDPDAAAVVQAAFEREGVRLALGASVERVERAGEARRILFPGGSWDADQILVSAGRIPNIEGLNLQAAGVEFDARGVSVNERLQTSNPRIYASGDVCLPWKFTHLADFTSRLAIQNALFGGRKKWTDLVVPWCTYTDPEVARVGLTMADAQARGIRAREFRRDLAQVDRAILDGEREGFVKIITRADSDRILGATIVARHAGEMIGELTLAIQKGIGLGALASVIHPYPTQAEAIRQTGDQFNRSRLTPLVKKLFSAWLAWTR